MKALQRPPLTRAAREVGKRNRTPTCESSAASEPSCPGPSVSRESCPVNGIPSPRTQTGGGLPVGSKRPPSRSPQCRQVHPSSLLSARTRKVRTQVGNQLAHRTEGPRPDVGCCAGCAGGRSSLAGLASPAALSEPSSQVRSELLLRRPLHLLRERAQGSGSSTQ